MELVNEIEREALSRLLEVGGVEQSALRQQLDHVVSVEREETGSGVYINFILDDSVVPLALKDDLELDGVFAKSSICNDEIGFILFVRGGLIRFLEAYTYSDVYPSYEECSFFLVREDPKGA